MKIIFARNRSVASLIIRLVTWSRWHHCAVIMPDGLTVIESRGGLWGDTGVIETPIKEFKSRYSTIEIAEIDCVDDQGYDFLRSQLGKKYDFLAIFGILFRTGWDNHNRWICSELIAGATGQFRKARVSRVTPEHLWMISK